MINLQGRRKKAGGVYLHRTKTRTADAAKFKRQTLRDKMQR